MRSLLSIGLSVALALQGVVTTAAALNAELAVCAAEAGIEAGECPCCVECACCGDCPSGSCDCMTLMSPATALALTSPGARLRLEPAAAGRIDFQAEPAASQTYAPLNPPPIR
jgi:hypothetical protein